MLLGCLVKYDSLGCKIYMLELGGKESVHNGQMEMTVCIEDPVGLDNSSHTVPHHVMKLADCLTRNEFSKL